MLVTYALVSLIGIAWLMRMIVEQRFIIRRTVFDIPLGLFVVSQILSTVFSIHPYTSLFGYYTRFHGGLLSTLTYVLLFYAFVSNVSKRQLPRLFLSLSLGALGSALYAIPEHFGHSPSCWMITNGQAFDASCWVQDVKSRVFGTFGQPNWLAAYAITIIPVLMSLSPKSLWKRAFNWVTVAALFATLLFTQSRSGQLGLAVGMGVFVIGVVWLMFKKKQGTLAVSAIAGKLVLLAGIALFFGTNFTPSLGSLVNPSSSPTQTVSPATTTQPTANRLEEGGTNSGEIRKIVWEGALAVARRYPLFGSGVETFAYSYYQDRPAAHNLVSEWDFLYNKAHNEFLNFLATTGIVGLTTYCLIFAWLGWHALRFVLNTKDTSESHPSAALLVVGLVSGLLALSVSNFFGFSTVMVSILLFWYLGLFEIITRPQLEIEPLSKHEANEELSSGQYVGLGVTGLIGLYLLWSIVIMWTADASYTRGKLYLNSGYTSEGLDRLVSATQQSPHEALFFDEVATTYAALAVQFARQGDATSAAQLAQTAIAASDQTLELNPRHLNFHKSRARIYITLAEIDPRLLNQATVALTKAISLSPTDAKLLYNLALVQLALGQTNEGLLTLEKTIALKPNYEAARTELAQHLINQGKLEEAKAQYQYILEKITPENQLIQEKLKAVEASLSAQVKR